MLESVIDKALQKHQEAHRAEISRLLQVIGGLEDKVDLLLEAPTGADRDVRSFFSHARLCFLADPPPLAARVLRISVARRRTFFLAPPTTVAKPL